MMMKMLDEGDRMRGKIVEVYSNCIVESRIQYIRGY